MIGLNPPHKILWASLKKDKSTIIQLRQEILHGIKKDKRLMIRMNLRMHGMMNKNLDKVYGMVLPLKHFESYSNINSIK